ncbi:MAG: hypothetical protein K6A74_09235 [Lachnospiraceae bacterium]|nr:hypothetical protein [Lachnospiraceae bacterium]
MKFVIVLTALVCILLIADILLNPSVKIKEHRIKIIYWFIPLAGAVVLLLSGHLKLSEVMAGLSSSGSVNPVKILILFISMTTLSIYLDEAGCFSYLAGISLKYAKTSQSKLFLYLYLMVSVLTVFTSNDIIILTFTPFICYFSKKASINPLPYLFGEFVAANTWSMFLIIGNPTNIYLATSAGVSFFEYTKTMFLPTLFAGTVTFIVLRLIFAKELAKPISAEMSEKEISNVPIVVLGVIHLGVCTLLLVISSYIGLEMWLITLAFAVSLTICTLIMHFIQKKKKGSKYVDPKTDKILLHTFVRAPWQLIPFVISMFLLVLSLEKYGVTSRIAELLAEDHTIVKYGIASFLSANVMNNIPMAVLFSSVTSPLEGLMKARAVYASVIGSNLGAYFTPLGALAGIMWNGILKKMHVEFSFKRFIIYGAPISFAALAAALAGLCITL